MQENQRGISAMNRTSDFAKENTSTITLSPRFEGRDNTAHLLDTDRFWTAIRCSSIRSILSKYIQRLSFADFDRLPPILY